MRVQGRNKQRHSLQEAVFSMEPTVKNYDLMIPGPISVRGEVLTEMAQPVVAHYGPDWVGVFNQTVEMAKQVFQTKSDLFIMAGSGHYGVEASLNSLVEPGEDVIIVSTGHFGDRAADLSRSHGANVHVLDVEWNDTVKPEQVDKALKDHPSVKTVAMVQSETSTGLANPVREVARVCSEHDAILIVDGVSSVGGMDIKVDEWGVDVCVTAAQKCLEAPPGLFLVSVSEKAYERMNARKQPISGWAMNILKWKESAESRRFHQPYYITMPVNNLRALRRSLSFILDEGLEARFARHRKVGMAFRDGVRKLGLEPVGIDSQASGLVGVFYVPEGHTDTEIVSFMKENYGIQVAGGLGELKGKTVRVGTMGPAARMSRIIPVLYGLKDWLSRL
jgi:alanine-glyoxylate transaminase/serine-glyoxylate transaminase/serine-pyruvate transaminase